MELHMQHAELHVQPVELHAQPGKSVMQFGEDFNFLKGYADCVKLFKVSLIDSLEIILLFWSIP